MYLKAPTMTLNSWLPSATAMMTKSKNIEAPNTQVHHSLADVEEQLQLDFAIWKSSTSSSSESTTNIYPHQQCWLRVGKRRGAATIGMGELVWVLTPPSRYVGYCEKNSYEWLLVSDPNYKVEICSPSSSHVLELCPGKEEPENLIFLPSSSLKGSPSSSACQVHLVDHELELLLSHLFLSQGLIQTGSGKLRRTTSQKTTMELLGESLRSPLLDCILSLRGAREIAEVLDSMAMFSGHYLSYQQLLQQSLEDPNFEANFYDEEVMNEEQIARLNRADIVWVREQVSRGALACRAATEVMSEVAKAGAHMLVKICESRKEPINGNHYNVEGEFKDEENVLEEVPAGNDIREVEPFEELSAGVPESDTWSKQLEEVATCDSVPSSQILEDFSVVYGAREVDTGIGGREIEDLNSSEQYGVNYTEASSSRIGGCGEDNWDIVSNAEDKSSKIMCLGCQSDMGADTGSESSWEFCGPQKVDSEGMDGVEVLGSQFSDAESLESMLQDLDPFGKHDGGDLFDGCFSLNTAEVSTPDTAILDEEARACALQNYRLQKGLSISTLSISGSLSSRKSLSRASTMSKFAPSQLETLTEEPACDERIVTLCLPMVQQAALEGNVLHWCSSKFNKDRCSIEVMLKVSSFMEDDIATISTGISIVAPLRVELFLDQSNVRQSLLEGRVRILTDQGQPFGPGVNIVYKDYEPIVSKPVVGLSCFIPHIVRRYLTTTHEKTAEGIDVRDEELLTGLMKHMVYSLVFLKQLCCVCGDEILRVMHTGPCSAVLPRPCAKNLCRALFSQWIVVSPPKILELNTVANWLKNHFKQHSNTDMAALNRTLESRGVSRMGVFYYDQKILALAMEISTDSWVEVPKPEAEKKVTDEASSSTKKSCGEMQEKDVKSRKEKAKGKWFENQKSEVLGTTKSHGLSELSDKALPNLEARRPNIVFKDLVRNLERWKAISQIEVPDSNVENKVTVERSEEKSIEAKEKYFSSRKEEVKELWLRKQRSGGKFPLSWVPHLGSSLLGDVKPTTIFGSTRNSEQSTSISNSWTLRQTPDDLDTIKEQYPASFEEGAQCLVQDVQPLDSSEPSPSHTAELGDQHLNAILSESQELHVTQNDALFGQSRRTRVNKGERILSQIYPSLASKMGGREPFKSVRPVIEKKLNVVQYPDWLFNTAGAEGIEELYFL